MRSLCLLIAEIAFCFLAVLLLVAAINGVQLAQNHFTKFTQAYTASGTCTYGQVTGYDFELCIEKRLPTPTP